MFIAFILLLFAYYFDFRNQNNKNKYLYYYSVLIVLILFAGLRYRIGLDTIRYMSYFQGIPTFNTISLSDWKNPTGYEPLYYLLVVISKSISTDFFVFQIIHATIVNSIIFYYIKNNTKYIFTGVFCYFIFCYLNFNCEILRESLAVSVFLISSKHLIRGQYLKYYLGVLIACLFHISALFLVALPLLKKIKLNYVVLIGTIPLVFLVGYLINSDSSTYLQLLLDLNQSLDGKIDRYSSSTLIQDMLSINGIIILMICNAIYPIASLFYLKKKNPILAQKFEMFIFMFVIVSILTLFIALFYRLLNYFIVFTLIIFSEAIINFYIKSRKYKKAAFNMVLIVFFPLFFFNIHSYFGNESNSNIKKYSRYHPYSSIIEEEEDRERELLFIYYEAQ